MIHIPFVFTYSVIEDAVKRLLTFDDRSGRVCSRDYRFSFRFLMLVLNLLSDYVVFIAFEKIYNFILFVVFESGHLQEFSFSLSSVRFSLF